MTWIKLTHVDGSVFINLENVHRFEKTSDTEITFYYATVDVIDCNPAYSGSTGVGLDNLGSISTAYILSSPIEVEDVLAKLSSVLKVINIDQLATQG